jgi:hypothetical protein
VIWGRAYMAQLDGCVLFFRDGVIEVRSPPQSCALLQFVDLTVIAM